MAKARLATRLSLDEWAQIMGINPLWFNGAISALFADTVCGAPWFQYAWQLADQVSREDLAIAIYNAEQTIERVVGFNLLPDWTTNERKQIRRPADPTVFNTNGLNTRYMRKSITTKKAHVISGGIKASSLLAGSSMVTRSDEDGDGYFETMTVSVTTTVTDPSEIHIFYAGRSAAPEWEIRPITVVISGGVATITFKSWQLFDPDLYERLNVESIDADDDGNYLTSVDVYRIYNDPSLMVQFLYEPGTYCNCGSSSCAQCSFGTQYGCLTVRDPRLGIMAYAPATWNSDNESYDAADWTQCRDPDQVIVHYYSGWRNENLDRPEADLDPFWKPIIAYYAAALLDRPVCGCDNTREFIKKWQMDKARSGREVSYTMMFSQIGNPFGTTEGGIYAFNQIIRTPGLVVAP